MSRPRRGPGAPATGCLLLGLFLAGLLLGTQPAAAAGEKAAPLIPPKALDGKWDPSKLAYPPLGALPQVKPERFVLDNGLIVYLVRDADLPDLQGSILLRAGSQYDPPEKAGLALLTAQVLRMGGTAQVPGDSLDTFLESIGASIEISAEISTATAGFRCLAEQQETVLRLLSELLRAPAFPSEKLELSRIQTHRSIAGRNDDPAGLARRLYRQLVWGSDHPYQRDMQYATVDAITPQDLREFEERFYAPNQAIMTIWGDLDPPAMKAELVRLFSPWAKVEQPLPAAPPAPSEDAGGGLYLAERPRMTQSYIYLAQGGTKADSPDYPALEVMGELLGGGFTSRIVNHIRTLRGLAYSAGAGSGASFAFPGTFVAYALTRSDSTLVTLGLLRKELDLIVSRPPSEDEVKRAREALLNSSVFNYGSPGQMAGRQAFYEFFGYPPGFLATYQEQLEKVTPEEVLRVARTHLHPDRMKVLVVGTESTFAQPLSTLAPVTRLDLTIPGAPEGPAGRGPGGGQGTR